MTGAEPTGNRDGVIAALQDAGWRQRALRGFAERMGPLWTRKEAEGWAYGILATPDHLNPSGFVHGGVLCALFDHVVSAVAWEAVVALVMPGADMAARAELRRVSLMLTPAT